MELLYKLCSIIYRLILALVIPVFVVAKVLVGAAGHNSDVTWSDYLVFAFSVITLTILTIWFRIGKEESRVRNIIHLSCITLVSISIVFEIYGLYDLFSNSEFSPGENIGISIVLLFTIVSLTVLWRIMKDKN